MPVQYWSKLASVVLALSFVVHSGNLIASKTLHLFFLDQARPRLFVARFCRQIGKCGSALPGCRPTVYLGLELTASDIELNKEDHQTQQNRR
jgi:hypothetical protein